MGLTSDYKGKMGGIDRDIDEKILILCWDVVAQQWIQVWVENEWPWRDVAASLGSI